MSRLVDLSLYRKPFLRQMVPTEMMGLEQAIETINAPDKEPSDWLTEAVKIVYQDDPSQLIANQQPMVNSMTALLKIYGKTRQMLALEPNQTQRRIIEAAFAMQDEGKPIRIIEMKGRQQGSSTGIGAYCFLRSICEPNTNSLIITEEKGGSAKNIFQMYKTFAEHLPIELAREFTREGTLMKFAQPVNSQIRVEGGQITSFTFQIVHLSEAAFFRNLRDTISMLYQTVPDTPDSAIFLETTANRHGDDFHQEWMRAVEGKSDFYPLFIPFYEHEEYQIEFETEQQKEQLANSLGSKDSHQYGNEQLLIDSHDGLTLEKMNWRRHAIRNRCAGSVFEFDRQYPSTWEVAFSTQTISIFDLHRVAQLKSLAPVPESGQFVSTASAVQFQPTNIPLARIYSFPENGYKSGYIIGCDVAEGLDTGDYSCAVIVKRLPLEVVAVIRASQGDQMTLDDFAEQVRLASTFYGNAHICVESNADGSAVNLLLAERGAKNLLREKDIDLSESSRYGWRNTSSTRRLGVALLQTHFNKGEFAIYDGQILQELTNFVTVNGKPQAAKKGQARKPGQDDQGWFDDGVFACISAVLAHEGMPAPKPSRWLEQKERQAERRQWEEERKPQSVWNYV